jgi:protein TilB
MVRITESLLARRAEHNDGMLLNLQEIGLHNQGIERIEIINQLCRHLRILYLQNNIICKIEKLNRLKVVQAKL